MIRIVSLCLLLIFPFPNYNLDEIRIPYKRFKPIVKEIKNIKASGFYPYQLKPHERKMEGPKIDKFGQPIRTMQCNYKYVTAAVDPDIIPLKTYFKIKELPGKIFYACDVGGKIKGKKIDIAVWNQKIAHQLPKYVTVQILDKCIKF